MSHSIFKRQIVQDFQAQAHTLLRRGGPTHVNGIYEFSVQSAFFKMITKIS